MKIYIDSDYRCHTTNEDGIYREIETNFFNGKCKDFIEGYRFIPDGELWVRDDDSIFHGKMISPWKPYDELDMAQRLYEKQTIQELQETVAELDAALLDSAYNNIVGGI